MTLDEAAELCDGDQFAAVILRTVVRFSQGEFGAHDTVFVTGAIELEHLARLHHAPLDRYHVPRKLKEIAPVLAAHGITIEELLPGEIRRWRFEPDRRRAIFKKKALHEAA